VRSIKDLRDERFVSMTQIVESCGKTHVQYHVETSVWWLMDILAKDHLVPSVLEFEMHREREPSVTIADVSAATHHMRNYFWPKRVICRGIGVQSRSTRLRV